MAQRTANLLLPPIIVGTWTPSPTYITPKVKNDDDGDVVAVVDHGVSNDGNDLHWRYVILWVQCLIGGMSRKEKVPCRLSEVFQR